MQLKCQKCAAELEPVPEFYECRRCRARWPVVGNIPRFFQDDNYYWGEVERQEAKQLLEDARRDSWIGAVRKHFPDRVMNISILDLQRAAWLPLLGLPKDAIALDIGSGYGAITHSLACSLSEVYSVEAIPERIEFTQTRLQQEGLKNVHLIQASAIKLPFFEESFDLVVANGVLEWVGEWDLEGDPRAAQLRFLTAAHGVLKEDGVMVVGIENRFGYGCFLGQLDHSGIPYTSLVPRRLATYVLRRDRSAHRRTVLNARREYRTYTYSARGYRKLLKQAGFKQVTLFWADAGYNQPYTLIPLSAPREIRKHFREQLVHPGNPSKMTWLRRVKEAVAAFGIPRWVLPDFVIVASKSANRNDEVQEWLRGELRRAFGHKSEGGTMPGEIVFSSKTHAFSSKHALRFVQPRWLGDRAVAKAHVRMPSWFEGQPAELANITLVRDHLAAAQKPPIRVPKPLGSHRSGSTLFYLESSASGTQFSTMVRKPGYFEDLATVQRDLSRIINASLELTELMQTCNGVSPIDPSWYEIPEDLNKLPGLCRRLEGLRYFSNLPPESSKTCVQHVDFAVENIFLEPQSSVIEVIDWEHLAAGLPPLYDVFQFISSLAYIDPRKRRPTVESKEDFYKASFADSFLSGNRLGQVIGDHVVQACRRLRISPDCVPSLLAEYLLIRLRYCRVRSITADPTPLALLRFYLEADQPLFGMLPVRAREPRHQS